jgi:hypothetical protein
MKLYLQTPMHLLGMVLAEARTSTHFTHFSNGSNFKYHGLQAMTMDFIVLLCYCHVIALTYTVVSLVASCV